MNTEINNETIRVWLFAGSDSDLTELDFSMINLKFYKINTSEFSDFFNEITHSDFKHLNDKYFQDHLHRETARNDVYVLVPIDFTKDVNKHGLVRDALLIMFPSDMYVYKEILFECHENKYLCLKADNTWPYHPSGKACIDILQFEYCSIAEINEFIRLFIERYEKLKYLKTTIVSYVNSFYESTDPMEYLNLCISLESIIDGKTELVYRIKRNVAIICGIDELHCQTIFKNITKIYDLRSTIVHGEEYEYKKIFEYSPYLRCLISQLIIELISLNINVNKGELGNRLTRIGFGDKDKLSNNYKLFHFNENTFYTLKNELN